MTQPQLKVAFIVLVIVIGFSNANSQVKPNPSQSLCPDVKPSKGRYRNVAYGFSIVIPAGLEGYRNSASCVPDESCNCLGDHGRFIPLSNDGNIEAYVAYQNEPDLGVIDHERDAISSLKQAEKGQPVKVVRSRWFRLGGLHARRFEARYLENNKPMIEDHIVALHNGVEYELILTTTPERYGADRRQLAKIIASWRLTRRG